jgi:hypothetical protein
MLAKSILRSVLIVLDAFLAVTAVAGGIGLLTGVNAPSTKWLEGSLFRSFTIPGLALLVIVGGCALAATALVLRPAHRGPFPDPVPGLRDGAAQGGHPWGALASGLAGVVIIGFEIVEVLIIGSPPGVARTLQIFYLALGLLIVIIAATQYWVEWR